MQNVWLMGVAQKRLSLSLLINNQPLGSLSQASLISSDLELPEMYCIKATERQRQQQRKTVLEALEFASISIFVKLNESAFLHTLQLSSVSVNRFAS